MIRGDSSRALLLYTLARYPRAYLALIPLGFTLAAWGVRLVPRRNVKQALLAVLDHVPSEEQESLLEKFHNEVLVPRYLRAARERLLWHRSEGHRLVLASASVDIYIRHVARHLQMDAFVCSHAALRPRARLVGGNCRGTEKVRRIFGLDFCHRIDWSTSWVYSDSLADLPLLRLCGHPVAVNSGALLRCQAMRNGWSVLDWED